MAGVLLSDDAERKNNYLPDPFLQQSKIPRADRHKILRRVFGLQNMRRLPNANCETAEGSGIPQRAVQNRNRDSLRLLA
jgi:hypothetical protein